jgi:hypothetical protein
MSRLGLGAFLGLRWSGREVNYTTLPSTKVKNEWSCTSTPHCIPFMVQTQKTVPFFHLKVKNMKQSEEVDLPRVVQDRAQQQPLVKTVITAYKNK